MTSTLGARALFSRVMSEGMWLAALPFLGLLYGFVFEFGYLSHFGVPFWMVSVSLKDALVAVAIIASAGMAITLSLELIPRGPWWGLITHVWSLALAVPVFYLLLSGVNWHSRLDAAISIGVAGLLAVAVAGEVYRRLVRPICKYEGTWLQRWAVEVHREIHAARNDAQHAMFEALTSRDARVPVWFFGGWLLLIVVPGAEYGVGRFVASHQTTFPVVDSAHPCILLRNAGTDYLCAELDSTRHQLTGNISILGAPKAFAFHPEHLLLGPLPSSESPSPLSNER